MIAIFSRRPGSGGPSARWLRRARSATWSSRRPGTSADIDCLDAGKRSEPRDGGGRDDDRGAVQDEAVAPADACARDRVAERSCETACSRSTARRASRPARAGQARERRRGERDDDLARRAAQPASTSAVPRAAGRQQRTRAQRSPETRIMMVVTPFGDDGFPAACQYPWRRLESPARGCGGIGRRARFRSVCLSGRGGSSPLIRMPGRGPSGPRSVERRRPRPGWPTPTIFVPSQSVTPRRGAARTRRALRPTTSHWSTAWRARRRRPWCGPAG